MPTSIDYFFKEMLYSISQVRTFEDDGSSVIRRDFVLPTRILYVRSKLKKFPRLDLGYQAGLNQNL